MSEKRKYWYLFSEYYYPACGDSKVYKERIYDRPKPKQWQERHIVHETWDYCDW